jgi:uncharacterized protein involved in exopolysaccharide biosynthesis
MPRLVIILVLALVAGFLLGTAYVMIAEDLEELERLHA